MNETIKKLREELHMPLKTALELVKNYGEDFEVCREKYHQNQILIIAQTTECDTDTAQAYYIRYGYDVEKVMKKIRERVVKIRVDESVPPKYKYGYQFYSFDAEGELSNKNDNYIFIHSEDFEWLWEAFESVFPVEFEGDVQHRFDATGSNYFGREQVQQVISYIRTMAFEDEKVKLFAQKVADWLEKQLQYATTIEVYGTL